MKQAIFSSVTLVCLFFAVPACNKKSKNAVAPPATIPLCDFVKISSTSASSGNTTIIDLTYNNDGQLAIMRQTGSNPFTKVLTYSGNKIIASSSGNSTKTDSIVLNNNGLISFLQSKDNTVSNAPRKTVNTFTYNSNGQLAKTTAQINDGAVTTTNYTFADGDLVSTDGTGAATYTYYTDKAFADGDYLKLIQLTNNSGLFVINKHLIKSVQTGSTIQNFIYEFDASGKITRLTGITGSTIETLDYSYNCR